MRLIFTATIFGGMCSAALASGPTVVYPDPVVMTPPPVAAYNWSGAYLGLQLGGITSSMTLTGENLNNNNTMESALDPSGMTLGVYGGFNFHTSGSMVLGLEGEYNWANASSVVPGVPAPSFGFMRDRIESTIDRTAALRLRAGFAAGETLFYGTAGLALADVTVNGFSTGGGNPFSYSDRLTGWTAGLGVERAIGNGWSVRGDYRYSDFGTQTINFDSGNNTPHVFNLATNTHELRLGLARRF